MTSRLHRFRVTGAFGVIAALALSAAAAHAQAPSIRVLSSSPARVTGGDALIEVTAPANAAVSVSVNGAASDAVFSPAANGARRGVITGLKPGANRIAVSASGRTAVLAVTNHAKDGPVFSGPQQTPFVCETETFVMLGGVKLGPPANANCDVETKVQYVYKTTAGGPLKPFEVGAARPADLARTVTTDGVTVDYVVRVETGVINRAVYQIAFLHEPGSPLPTPTRGTPGWNGKLVYTFGGGCGAAYRQGRGTAGVINNGEIGNDALDLGFAQASSSLNVLGGNCNDVTSAETAMMVKEHFVESFGPPKHTIGIGGSGGSMQQHLLTQNYPGILDGLIPGRSYPDTATILPSAADCPLLTNYFSKASMPWSEEQTTAVTGMPSNATCVRAWTTYLPRWVSPLWNGCDAATAITAQEAAGGTNGRTGAIPRALLYDPASNPSGARCGYYDNAVNVYGRRPDGVSRSALDNVGVQYGIKAFNAGKISAEQFVELNEKVGGFDDDGNLVARRITADPQALRASYETGRINAGVGLDLVPILDVRSYVDNVPQGDVHTRYTSSVMRARLIKTNGDADNQVIWTTATLGTLGADMRTPMSPLRQTMRQAIVAMDGWLNAIERDTSATPKALKIVRNKPASLTDACFTESMERINEPDTYNGTGRCSVLFPNHADPRLVAGAPMTLDVLKCALRPLRAADYSQPLNADQLRRLNAAFPQGVCDYSKPGVGQRKPIGPWVQFTDVGVYRVSLR